MSEVQKYNPGFQDLMIQENTLCTCNFQPFVSWSLIQTKLITFRLFKKDFEQNYHTTFKYGADQETQKSLEQINVKI